MRHYLPHCELYCMSTISFRAVSHLNRVGVKRHPLADGLTPNGDRPSRSTALTARNEVFFQPVRTINDFKLRMDIETSFKTADEIFRHIASLGKFRSGIRGRWLGVNSYFILIFARKATVCYLILQVWKNAPYRGIAINWGAAKLFPFISAVCQWYYSGW